jgi:hypothetical protein
MGLGSRYILPMLTADQPIIIRNGKKYFLLDGMLLPVEQSTTMPAGF